MPVPVEHPNERITRRIGSAAVRLRGTGEGMPRPPNHAATCASRASLWVDIDPPVSLLACHRAGEFGYADGGAVTGSNTTSAPFPVEIDLDALL